MNERYAHMDDERPAEFERRHRTKGSAPRFDDDDEQEELREQRLERLNVGRKAVKRSADRNFERSMKENRQFSDQ